MSSSEWWKPHVLIQRRHSKERGARRPHDVLFGCRRLGADPELAVLVVARVVHQEKQLRAAEHANHALLAAAQRRHSHTLDRCPVSSSPSSVHAVQKELRPLRLLM